MTYTLKHLATEQEELRLDHFDYDFVWALGKIMRERASALNLPVAIEISHGMTPVFAALMPGATLDNLDWTARKRAVTHRFHRSSLPCGLRPRLVPSISMNGTVSLARTMLPAVAACHLCFGTEPLLARPP